MTFITLPPKANLGACTHTGKTGVGPESGARGNVNKWVYSHSAGPAELPVRQASVPDSNLKSQAQGWWPGYQFQWNWIGSCTPVGAGQLSTRPECQNYNSVFSFLMKHIFSTET
jgi:hypothetical protein